ncbi:hypothetical protein [Paenibacillus allorhizoplanae]|nr:hypothetical protein [Paenibacillus allorhizoplanae]
MRKPSSQLKRISILKAVRTNRWKYAISAPNRSGDLAIRSASP